MIRALWGILLVCWAAALMVYLILPKMLELRW